MVEVDGSAILATLLLVAGVSLTVFTYGAPVYIGAALAVLGIAVTVWG
jgi:hypothetical protein